MKLPSAVFFTTTLGLALTLAASMAWTPAEAQSGPRISREQVNSMLSDVRAKTSWNVDGPLLWGYFFFDPSREKLEQAASELRSKGYRVVGLEQVNRELFRLHVEKVEIHTATSLDVRNREFYALADRYSIASYDGMDVGPVKAPGAK